MPAFRYHLSSQPAVQLPDTNELAVIEATSPADVAQRLLQAGAISPGAASGWVHVLIWNSNDGKLRGFESISFAEISETPCR